MNQPLALSRRGLVSAGALATLAPLLAGCTGDAGAGSSAAGSAGSAGAGVAAFRDTDLGCDLGAAESVALACARRYTLDAYPDGYRLACMDSGERYLIVPSGAQAPEGLAEDVIVLQQPLRDVYLVSTGMICLLDELGALDAVRVASVRAENSPNDALAALIDSGAVVYGGRYRDPDFELIAAEGCPVAIENTQINRYPEVKRKLEELGCAVLTELSSTEDAVLGRLEWIRLMGALFDRTQEADAFFDEVRRRVEEAAEREPSGRSIVFFYLDEDGAAVVRRAGDYFTQMIELAGGIPISFDKDPDAEASSTTYITVEMESFYAAAKDADIVIYNATVDESVGSVADLVAKNDLLGDFAAVRAGEVFTCDSNLYQQMTATPDIIDELAQVLAGQDGPGRFIWRLG